ncbi:hypothetical protein COT27_03095 [Candidatus Kuenenbacteria bacterium CG08_land_8_20_14_0_20_37_23]|uniref:CxxC-x17-CxxC domain-containing protein n=1 Tax=Candidatus Kuenenbacteria bacterium CG08_land_8_20_14_0_20_37_23 TaxID=1974617 RepID=A0A2M6XS84_9BACT|nr:MAG: hypothetical protein COT27_03095 [Candidatus Kuenenbacteria bacterium CG08_land_8_20_14_0_20_37_23]
MGNFNRGNKLDKGRGSRNFGRRSFGTRDFSRQSMYKVICDKCGKSCEVPFKPKGDKPVYCNNCFEGKGNRNDISKRLGARDFGGRGFDGKESSRTNLYHAVCDKCGNHCEVPFKPSGGKPVYCNACFAKNRGKDSCSDSQIRNKDRFGEELENINIKLDKILQSFALRADKKLTPFADEPIVEVFKEEAVEDAKKSRPRKVTIKVVAKKETAVKKVIVKKNVVKKIVAKKK